MPSSLISRSKSQLLIGEAAKFEDLESLFPNGDFNEENTLALETDQVKPHVIKYMLDTARCFRELEMLLKALDALDQFAMEISQFEE